MPLIGLALFYLVAYVNRRESLNFPTPEIQSGAVSAPTLVSIEAIKEMCELFCWTLGASCGNGIIRTTAEMIAEDTEAQEGSIDLGGPLSFVYAL